MKKAFTLIELLVVIAIIGVLTSIVLAQFSVVRAKARDAKRVSDISQMQLAIQQYFDRCNQYPNATGIGPNEKLDINSSVGCPNDINNAKIKLSAFLNQIPTPPSEVSDTGANTYDYRYVVRNTGGVNDDYYIAARLEQKNKALDDDIDGNIPSGSDPQWKGWSFNGVTTINVNDSSDPYMYAVRSR